MKDKYFSAAENSIGRIKPVIEKRLGVELGDVHLREACTFNGYIDDLFDDTYMFVNNKQPDTIYINGIEYESENAPTSKVAQHVAHELAHLAHLKLDKSSMKRNKSFIEGFAEYLSLDELVDVYNSGEQEQVWQVRNKRSCYSKDNPDNEYGRGYKFFRKVLNVLGSDKLEEVAVTHPLNDLEVNIPLLYLLRTNPVKTIPKIPFFAQKYVKAMKRKRFVGSGHMGFPFVSSTQKNREFNLSKGGALYKAIY